MTQKQLPLHIDAVTVYPDQARLLMQSTAELDRSVTRLVVDGLPLALDPDSVRAAGEGTARVTIGGVDLQRVHLAEAPVEKVRALESEIDAVRDQIQTLDNQTATLKAQLGHIDGLRSQSEQYARALAFGRLTVDKQAEIGRYLQTADGEIRAEMLTLAQARREQQQTLDRLQRELDQLRSQKPRQQYRAGIEIAVAAAGTFTLALTVVVRRAGWRPLYDIRLTGEPPDTVAVTAQAQVTQSTGQDWTGVKLTISTARPALTQQLPTLPTWYIDEHKPMPRPQVRSAKVLRDEMPTLAAAPAAAEMAAPAPQSADLAVAEMSGETTRTFTVAGRCDIPSDGSPHKVVLNQIAFTPTIDYLTLPKHTPAVYRRARLNNDSGAPLLAGPASLFVGAAFIGRTQLAYTAAGDEIELLLGVEERITVERELVRRETDKRLLGDRRQLRYGYTITCKNLLPSDAHLTVEDHYPVSRHEQVRVRWDKATPAPDEHTDLHAVTWRLKLAPDTKQEIAYSYSVEHPRSMRVAGLLD